MPQNKERIDIILVKNNYYVTREKAKKNILAGLVYVDGVKIIKAGELVDINSKIEIKGEAIPYASRGGLKLEKAINEFKIPFNNKIAIDVGASTGGFTDCMLKNGASKVFAIDSGTDQLSHELKNNASVISMEKTNIRYIKSSDIGVLCDIATIDVSFISLKQVIPIVINLIKDTGEIVCLIKPQFEAGKNKIGKNGIIKNKSIHKDILLDLSYYFTDLNLSIYGLTYSPIKGQGGNIEYLIYLKKGSLNNTLNAELIIEKIIKDAFNCL